MDARQKKTVARKDVSRVFIVDDHPIIRQGLGQLIDNEKDLSVCGQAEDAYEALKAIVKLEPDLIIVDISLKHSNGLELIKNLRQDNQSMGILVLSMHNESLYAERGLRAGANGYIMKEEAPAKIIGAIRRILNGKIYVSENVSMRMLSKLVNGKAEALSEPIESLTDRELEVFGLIGQGRGTRQIAKELHLSMKTIESYRAHIKDKLNLANAAELVQHAIQWVHNESSF